MVRLIIERLSSSLGPAGIVGGGGGANVQRSLHLQYPDWVTREQDTEPPTALRTPQHKWLHTVCVCVCVCSRLCVCTMDGLNTEHKFRI